MSLLTEEQPQMLIMQGLKILETIKIIQKVVNQKVQILVYIPREVILTEVLHKQLPDRLKLVLLETCNKRLLDKLKVHPELLIKEVVLTIINSLIQHEDFKILVG